MYVFLLQLPNELTPNITAASGGFLRHAAMDAHAHAA